MMSMSVCPSVCDGSALAHYSYFGFKCDPTLPRIAAAVLLAPLPPCCFQHGAAVLLAVLLAGGSSRAMLASARLSCYEDAIHFGVSGLLLLFSARCNIRISRLCYDVSVRLSVTEVHWVAVHAENTAAAPACEVEAIIRSPTNIWPPTADGGVISRYASHC